MSCSMSESRRCSRSHSPPPEINGERRREGGGGGGKGVQQPCFSTRRSAVKEVRGTGTNTTWANQKTRRQEKEHLQVVPTAPLSHIRCADIRCPPELPPGLPLHASSLTWGAGGGGRAWLPQRRYISLIQGLEQGKSGGGGSRLLHEVLLLLQDLGRLLTQAGGATQCSSGRPCSRLLARRPRGARACNTCCACCACCGQPRALPSRCTSGKRRCSGAAALGSVSGLGGLGGGG